MKAWRKSFWNVQFQNVPHEINRSLIFNKTQSQLHKPMHCLTITDLIWPRWVLLGLILNWMYSLVRKNYLNWLKLKRFGFQFRLKNSRGDKTHLHKTGWLFPFPRCDLCPCETGFAKQIRNTTARHTKTAITLKIANVVPRSICTVKN